jgi:ribosomal-protein-alanine N-acetyltransferase
MDSCVRLELLTTEHTARLETFEKENRAFFASRITDRGDQYFEEFAARLAALVQENAEGTSLLCVVVDDGDGDGDGDGDILGRVNITDIDQPELTELGFRVAERAQGRGVASAGVRLALAQASQRGVRTVRARVSTTNAASQRVLERCGFRPTGPAEPPAGTTRTFLGYRKDLPDGSS